MVRILEGTSSDETPLACETGNRMDLRYFKGLFEFKRRQDGRETLCKHRLSGAWRPDHEYVVTACGGNLQCALRDDLTTDFGKVDGVLPVRRIEMIGIGSERLDGTSLPASESAGDLARHSEIAHGIDIDSRDDCRLGSVLLRKDDVAKAGIPDRDRDRQCSTHRPHPTIERQLAHAERPSEIIEVSDLTARTENPEGDRKIETRSFLLEVGRCEIDRGLLNRKEVTAVDDCRADPLPRLPHGGVGKSDDDDGRSLLVLRTEGLEMHFDVDYQCVYSIYRSGLREKKHKRPHSLGGMRKILRMFTKNLLIPFRFIKKQKGRH